MNGYKFLANAIECTSKLGGRGTMLFQTMHSSVSKWLQLREGIVSMERINEAATLSNEMNERLGVDYPGRALGQLEQATLLSAHGKLRTSMRHVREALKTLERMGENRSDEYFVCLRTGLEIQLAARQFNIVLDQLMPFRLFDANCAIPMVYRSDYLMIMGQAHFALGHLQDANNCFDAQQKQFENGPCNDPKYLCVSQCMRGRVKLMQGELTVARQMIEPALDRANSILGPSSWLSVSCLQYLAEVEIAEGNIQKAHELLAQAIDLGTTEK